MLGKSKCIGKCVIINPVNNNNRSKNLQLFQPILNKKIASYIVCNHTQLLHGLIRKATPDTNRGNNKFGAAGTDIKFWGKWGGCAGTPSTKSKHKLDAITREISDEIGYKIENKDVVLLDHNNSPSGKNLLYLIDYIETNNMIYFVFEMPYNIFINIFPRNGNINHSLLKTSHGEIDAIGSFTTTELLFKQETELTDNNNFMLSYYIESFNNKIVNILCNKYSNWCDKWSNNFKFNYIKDIIARQPLINEI